MSDFTKFSAHIKKNVDEMIGGDLFTVIDGKEERRALWNNYLDAFPEGTNEIYKERREYDCICCKNFVRDLGGVVDASGRTIWRNGEDLPHPFNVVAKKMDLIVSTKEIKTLANVHPSTKKRGNSQLDIGKEFNVSDSLVRYNHFYAVIPGVYAGNSATRSGAHQSVQVLKRALEEITPESVTTVLDVISDGNLYRGDEFKDALVGFRKLMETGDTSSSFLWTHYKAKGARIRSTVIGTLLIDLSEGVDLETAVKKFEDKVAPYNYKRPKSLVTKKMIEAAVAQIREAGLEDALYRRFATPEDLSVNDMLFVDGKTKTKMRDALMDDLMNSTSVVSTEPNKKDITEISASDFVNKVLPGSKRVEVRVDNRLAGNLMSIIGPTDDTAENIMKWDNPFSWSYRGEVADSMQERVKKYGGSVDAHTRVSLAWHNRDDLDIQIKHLGTKLFYGHKSAFGARLDVDANAGTIVDDPVENIVWKSVPGSGVYRVEVNQYQQRSSANPGFTLQFASGGVTTDFTYDKHVTGLVHVFDLKVSPQGVVTVVDVNSDLSFHAKSDLVWDIATEQYQDVSLITKSPNFWGDQAVGNEHLLFVIDGCRNDETPRGFYNEFLKGDIAKNHRKVFEVLGSKTKCAPSDNQLSGLGFSSTMRNHVLLKIDNRPYKVNF